MADQEPQILRIRLTREELLVLYELATEEPDQVPREDIVPGYSEEKLAYAREFARRSLRARELITLNGSGEYELHSFAINLVGVSLVPDSTTQLLFQGADGESHQLEFFRYQDDIFLAHGETDDGLHDFEFLLNQHDYERRILDALRLEAGSDPDGTIAHFPQADLFTLLDHATNGNSDELEEALDKLELPEMAAEALAATLTDSFELKRLTVAAGVNEDSQEMVFLSGGGYLWQLKPESNGQEKATFHIQPISVEAAENQVRKLYSSN